MKFFPASPPIFLKKILGGLVWNIPTRTKKIYLTFDDGPIPESTPFVLEILNQYNAKATFFCIGDNITKNPAVFKAIIEEGHRIGNHTQQHLNAWSVSHKIYIANIEKAEKTLYQNHKNWTILGRKKLFRPPYGKVTPKIIRSLKERNYSVIMWDVLSFDWKQNQKPEKCLETVLKHTKPGSIIVFHDSIKAYKNMTYTLPKVLEYYSKKGFTFESL